MPNHVLNVMKIKASQALLNKIRFEMTGKSEEEILIIDFESIIPMPKYIFRGPIGDKELKKYGKNNWYDWSNENWGTKWNAYAQGELSQDEIYFETAWASPFPVFVELSKKYPEAEFKLKYADEDTGYNLGRVVFKNGKFHNPKEYIFGSEEAKSFARRLRNSIK